VPDEQSAPYWAAAARHELVAAHCRVCKMFAIPPDVVCPHCGAVDNPLSFEPLTGRGVVRSWTVVENALVPGFEDEVPFLLVDVELADQAGLRMTGRLLDGPGTPIRVGTPVAVTFEDVAPGVAIPAFVLARHEQG
jgi:uncharacterized OB-fold protein